MNRQKSISKCSLGIPVRKRTLHLETLILQGALAATPTACVLSAHWDTTSKRGSPNFHPTCGERLKRLMTPWITTPAAESLAGVQPLMKTVYASRSCGQKLFGPQL